jgi:hypothetical protein
MIALRRALPALGVAVSLMTPVAVSGVAATVSESPADAATTLAEVQRVLDARVAAVARNDRAAWIATVDPDAPARFRLAQASSFDGLRSLPLATFSLTARLDDTGDLGVGLSSRYGGAPTFLPETRMRMRLADYDDRDDVQSLYLTFVRRGGRWYIAGDTDLAPIGIETFRGLWDQGPVVVQRTPHFLVLSHPPDATRARTLASIAEDAIGRLDARWDRPWSHRVPMILPSSLEELALILQATFDLQNFVAFVSYGSVRDQDWQATAPRIYIQDVNLSRYPRDYQVRTLTHELDHVAVAPLAGPMIPSWLHEGVADWVALGERTDERKPSGSDGRLPRDFEFTLGGGTAINLSYAESRSAMSFLAAHSGRAAPGALIQRLGAERASPGSEEYLVDQALQQVSGLTVTELEKEWAAR